jgi:rhamnosyl/mannosyltransferase
MAHNKVPLVATYHADIDRGSVAWPVYRRLLHRVLSACGRVLVASDRLVGSSSVLSRLAEEPGLVEVVPFGVDTERFHPGDGATAEQGASLPIVLFVGRLRYDKGLPYLIEAVARTDARLVIAGDGRERARIESLGRTRLGDRFTLLPDVSESELADLYRSATMFSLPSTSSAEAFGLATLEAMASGLPVITTELGTATSEINVDGVTGLVVPPRDVDALTDALDQLLGDEALRRRMAQASRARVVERYERQQMLDRISGIYEQVRAERNLSGHG